MKCPYCNNPDTRVIDSRPAEDGNSIRRRRSCDECGKRFTTYEKVETIPLIIIKKDNNREQYDRSKIEGGVLRACYKRPVSADQIKATVDAIETEIFNREAKEIPREQYDRSKIEGGVLRACYKRPVSADQIKATVDAIETEIFNREAKEIPSKLVGEIVMEHLKNLDAVAYVRFASVYREFKDVNTFMAELKKMLDK